MSKKVISLLRTSSGLDEFPLYRALITNQYEVINFDDRNYGFHNAPNLLTKITRRLNRKALAKSMNEELLRNIDNFKPSFLLVFKASQISADVVNKAKHYGAKTVCIYPDLNPFVYGQPYIEALRAFDVLFHTKPNLQAFFSERISHHSQLISPFYDPETIADILPVDLSIGVSFVGHHSNDKQKSLKIFADHYDGTLTIVGEGWRAEMFSGCKAKVNLLPPLFGSAVQNIYRRSICSLGLLMEAVDGQIQGDEISSRSILAPAVGGLLLHSKTPAASALYKENDALLFETMQEAAQKSINLANNPKLRFELAANQQKLALHYGTNPSSFLREFLGA